MSDEINKTNDSGRLDRIEEILAETVMLQREMQKTQMQDEFKFAEYRKQSEDRFARIESTLEHLTKLVGIFGDKSYEFDEKFKRIKDVV